VLGRKPFPELAAMMVKISEPIFTGSLELKLLHYFEMNRRQRAFARRL